MIAAVIARLQQAVGYIRPIATWGKSILSERNGNGSASRFTLSILILTCCYVLIYDVRVHHALPSKEQLIGLAALASVGAGSYAVNRFTHREDATSETADPTPVPRPDPNLPDPRG